MFFSRWIGVGLVSVSLLAACGDDGGGGSPKKDTGTNEDTDDGPDTPDAGCTAGALACACTSAGTCNSGLVCEGGMCATEDTDPPAGLTIGTPDARACEILFIQNGARITGASYGSGTKGALRRRDPNVAVAVARDSDTPFAADSVALTLEGDVANVAVAHARCFDAAGVEIANTNVTLR